MKKSLVRYTIILLVLSLISLIIGCQKQTLPTAAMSPTATATSAISISSDSTIAATTSLTATSTTQAVSPPLTGKIYSNSQYGFSVQYTSDWTFQEGIAGTIVMFGGPLIAETGGMININITSEKLPGFPKLSLSDYSKLGEMQLQKVMENYNQVNEHSTTISGQPALVRVFTGSVNKASLKFAQAYLIKENSSYVITYASNPDLYDKYIDSFNLAITSLKIN